MRDGLTCKFIYDSRRPVLIYIENGTGQDAIQHIFDRRSAGCCACAWRKIAKIVTNYILGGIKSIQYDAAEKKNKLTFSYTPDYA